MRTVAQNKMIDNFINYVSKLEPDTQIIVLEKIQNDNHDGNLIQIKRENILGTYFIGVKKDFNDFVIEKMA